MTNERHIICGEAAPNQLLAEDPSTIRLHLYGHKDDDKLTLKIDDIEKSLFKEVPPRFRDLLDLATYVYGADQMCRRGALDVETFGSNWRRELHFYVPVRDLDFWRAADVQGCLTETLGFLSGDAYHFEFVPLINQDPFQQFLTFSDEESWSAPEQVIMYSGGLDSLGGAVEEAVNQKRHVVLVNHRPTQKLDKRYARLQSLLDAKAPHNRPSHIRVTVQKKKWMNREATQRGRSFLYVVLGATIANMLGHSNVRFYENGVVSLNLPICAQVVGSKATRTTHPKVLRGFVSLLTLVAERTFQIENPFQWKTKSEVVAHIGKAGCAELINEPVSCTHTWDITNEKPHCGYCSQCVDRRFAVIAAGLEKYDPLNQYGMDVFTESRSKRKHVNADKTLFAGYLERANQVTRLEGPLSFLKAFPEVARVLPFLDGSLEAGLQRCFEMYKRHATEVNGVVDEMGKRHFTAIRERSLPVDSMIRIVYESYLPITAPVIATNARGALPDYVFRRKGAAWQVRYRGQNDFILVPCKGATYIHRLLSSPGKTFTAMEIICGEAAEYATQLMSAQEAIESGLRMETSPLMDDLGKVADWTAVKQYRDKARELLAELERARAEGDLEAESELKAEMYAITNAISKAVGLRGNLTEMGDNRRKTRNAFANAVNRAIEKIEETDRVFAKHLKDSISKGNDPVYKPTDIEWETQPVIND